MESVLRDEIRQSLSLLLTANMAFLKETLVNKPTAVP